MASGIAKDRVMTHMAKAQVDIPRDDSDPLEHIVSLGGSIGSGVRAVAVQAGETCAPTTRQTEHPSPKHLRAGFCLRKRSSRCQ